MKIIAVAVTTLFLISGVVVVSAENASDEKQLLPCSNGIMSRLVSRILATLGICQNGDNLSELSGVMIYDGTNFYIGTVELHFGPRWYITSTISSDDFDSDGEYELIINELFGLVNTTVTVEGYYQSQDWMSVFTINGEVYRELGQPIWAGQPKGHRRHGNGNNKP